MPKLYVKVHKTKRELQISMLLLLFVRLLISDWELQGRARNTSTKVPNSSRNTVQNDLMVHQGQRSNLPEESSEHNSEIGQYLEQRRSGLWKAQQPENQNNYY